VPGSGWPISATTTPSCCREREVSTKAKVEITNKLKVALEGEVKLPGNVTVKVELYGSFLRKYPGDEAPKTGIEGGLVLSVPF
jgi:hypothetical protein